MSEKDKPTTALSEVVLTNLAPTGDILRPRRLRTEPYQYEPEPEPLPAQEGDVAISMPLASATIILEGGDS